MNDKFDQTNINISKKDLKKIWGKADRELIDNQRNIFIYKDYLGYEYIFASQKGHDNISQKFLND